MAIFNQINPFDNLNPFGRGFKDTLNEMAAVLSRFASIESSIHRKLKEIIIPWSSGGEIDIVAQVTGSEPPDGAEWPRVYDWEEIMLESPTTYITKPNGQSGAATNRNETIAGFGDTVGPWGASLDSDGATLTVLPIPIGQPIIIKMEPVIVDDVPVLQAMFSGNNAYSITCDLPPLPVEEPTRLPPTPIWLDTPND